MESKTSNDYDTKQNQSEERRDDTYSVRGLDAELDHVIDASQ